MLRRLLDRPIAVTMTTIVLVILGIVSSRLLPISLVPDVDAPYITIQIPAQGISARQLNETVITPLRQQLIQLSQLVDLRSEAREGNGIIRLTFEQGSNIDYLFIEVNEKIDRSVSSLPRDLERPKVIKASATDIPAFYINLTLRDEHPATERDELFPVSEEFSALSRFAAQVITKRIEQLPEVAMVDLSGCVSSELLVLPDETKLRQAGITMNDIEQALKRADVSLGSLTIRDGEYQYNVKFRSAVSGKNDVENIFLKINGRLFRLKELARVIEHPRKRQGMISSDGRSAVSLAGSNSPMPACRNSKRRFRNNSTSSDTTTPTWNSPSLGIRPSCSTTRSIIWSATLFRAHCSPASSFSFSCATSSRRCWLS